MLVLITGQEGFTGQHLARHLQAHGHRPAPLACDLTNPADIGRALAAAPDLAQGYAVVHLAAIAHVAHADAAEFYRVNTVGTQHLLDALSGLSKAPKMVLLASSANVYGNCTRLPITEDTPPAPVNHYAISKLAMELLSRNYTAHFPITITRPFNYTGHGQHISFVIPKLVHHFASRLPRISLGNLDVHREYNDIRTVCESYRHLIETGPAPEVFNLCSGKTHALGEIVEMLCQITSHRPAIDFDPALARRDEVTKLFGNPEKFNRWLAQSGRGLTHIPIRNMLERMLTEALKKR